MFREKNSTRLIIDFDFCRVSALVIAVVVIIAVFCWSISWNLLDAIMITVIIGAGGSISYASERERIKRKYLKNIQKAL
ncbi:MAG: hypothetical protein GWO20_03590, partial [Candidatus Korarchaeota archaeon]|nr:hypothetical protein [Candidatus Korarchaeota archaeon]